jgi:DNA mismatch repair ATPase MutS
VRKKEEQPRAATGAERQATYRERHLTEVDTVDSSGNMIVPVATKRALERLENRYAVTQHEMLWKVIQDARTTRYRRDPSADLRRYYD